MKSERQQIQESDLLADKIEAFLVKAKKQLPQVLGILIIAIVVLLGWGIYRSVQNSQTAKGWTALYFSDTETSDLTSIAEDFSGTPAGLWARQAAADSHLAKAVESVYSNRDVADKHYKNASAEYRKVVEGSSEGFLTARASYGLAQSLEGLGERDEAIAAYRKISSLNFIDPEFKAEANKRADWLESTAGEEFMTWYKANRKNTPAIAPGTDKPSIPELPTFDFPGMKLPESSTPTGDSTDKGTPSTPDSTAPEAPAGSSTNSAAPPLPASETAPVPSTPEATPSAGSTVPSGEGAGASEPKPGDADKPTP